MDKEIYYIKIVGRDVLTNEFRTLWFCTYEPAYKIGRTFHGWLHITEVTYFVDFKAWTQAFRSL